MLGGVARYVERAAPHLRLQHIGAETHAGIVQDVIAETCRGRGEVARLLHRFSGSWDKVDAHPSGMHRGFGRQHANVMPAGGQGHGKVMRPGFEAADGGDEAPYQQGDPQLLGRRHDRELLPREYPMHNLAKYLTTGK
jgi:hypothetical protein